MTEFDILGAFSYIWRSKNRTDLVLYLADTIKMPSEIAKHMNIRINQVSAILKDLKNENIVVCLNESEKKGRLYELTPKGKETYKYILKNMEQN